MENKPPFFPNQCVNWCLRLIVISAVVPFVYAQDPCQDGICDPPPWCEDGILGDCIPLPPWCQDGMPDNCNIQYVLTFEIKPYSEDRCLKLDGKGVIPTIIFGGLYLYVDYIDTTKLSLNGMEVRLRGAKGPLCSIHDANQDGYPDLFCQFEDDPSEWVAGDSSAELSGYLLDGTTQISGSETICVQ